MYDDIIRYCSDGIIPSNYNIPFMKQSVLFHMERLLVNVVQFKQEIILYCVIGKVDVLVRRHRP